MLPIEECRKLIDDSDKMTDEQIIEVRDVLYSLADLSLDAYFQEKGITLTDSYTKAE